MGNWKILSLIVFFFFILVVVGFMSQNVFAACSGNVDCQRAVNVCSSDNSTSCSNPGQSCSTTGTGSLVFGTCKQIIVSQPGSCSGTANTCASSCPPEYQKYGSCTYVADTTTTTTTTTTLTSGKCTPGQWSGCGCGGNSDNVGLCNSSGTYDCIPDLTKCRSGGSSGGTTTTTSGNTCTGITYSTVPTTPVASQPLELLISRANATSSCGINNVGLIYDGVSYWSPNHGFTLSLNGSTGYKADFTSIPSGTHTFQFTFANDACLCNTYSLAVSSGVGTSTASTGIGITLGIQSGSVSQTAVPTITAPVGCSLKTQGDANCDGKVDDADYQIWKCEFLGGGNCTNPASHLTASFDLNTKVDLVDFEIWREHSSTTADAPTITRVPLPTAVGAPTAVPFPTANICSGGTDATTCDAITGCAWYSHYNDTNGVTVTCNKCAPRGTDVSVLCPSNVVPSPAP